MPLRSWDTKADWDAAYNIGAEPEGHPGTRPEVRLNYHRFVMLPVLRDNLIHVSQLLGWTNATRVVIVGCGFGWGLEAVLDELGLAQAIGLDTSAYIQNTKTLNEDSDIAAAVGAAGLSAASGEGLTIFNRLRNNGVKRAKYDSLILNENIALAAARNRIRNAMGAPHTYEIYSEDVLTSLTDSECQQASTGAHNVSSGRVSHLVTTSTLGLPQDGTWNSKTLEQWKALIPADTFIEPGTWRVL